MRFGGHREENEIAIECLKREIKEEASILMKLVDSPITYYIGSWDEEPQLTDNGLNEDIRPIVIKGGKDGEFSVTYFAYSHEEPKPDHETHGILFLRLEDVDLIYKGLITINDIINNRGKVILQKELRKDVILKPGVHLKLLLKLYKKNPDLIEKFIDGSLKGVIVN